MNAIFFSTSNNMRKLIHMQWNSQKPTTAVTTATTTIAVQLNGITNELSNRIVVHCPI